MILPNGQMLPEGVCDHYPLPLPNYMPLAPQLRCTPSGQPPDSCGQGSSQVPSTKVALGNVWHATISSQIGTGERALDLWVLMLAGPSGDLLPWYQLGMALPHQGVPGGGDPVVGGHSRSSSPSTSTSLDQLASSCGAVSVCHIGRATSRPHLLWHHALGSLPSVRVPSLQQSSPNTSAW